MSTVALKGYSEWESSPSSWRVKSGNWEEHVSMAPSPHRAVGDFPSVLQWCLCGLLEAHCEAQKRWTLRSSTFSWMIISDYPPQISRHPPHRNDSTMVLRRNPRLWCLWKIYKNGPFVHDFLLNSIVHRSPKTPDSNKHSFKYLPKTSKFVQSFNMQFSTIAITALATIGASAVPTAWQNPPPSNAGGSVCSPFSRLH
jgi:hypothetical protein